jgi:hypothetical protein
MTTLDQLGIVGFSVRRYRTPRFWFRRRYELGSMQADLTSADPWFDVHPSRHGFEVLSQDDHELVCRVKRKPKPRERHECLVLDQAGLEIAGFRPNDGYTEGWFGRVTVTRNNGVTVLEAGRTSKQPRDRPLSIRRNDISVGEFWILDRYSSGLVLTDAGFIDHRLALALVVTLDQAVVDSFGEGLIGSDPGAGSEF